jgi:hypothetical protein
MSWELEIFGDENDLRALGHSLRKEEYLIQEKDGHFVLCGPVFSKFQDARAVREHGGKIVKSLSGLARLLLGSQKEITTGAVFEITENGGKNIFYTPDPVTIKLKASMAVSAIVISKDGKIIEECRPADPAPSFLKKALEHVVVERALKLRDEDNLDWVALFRLVEVIESDIPMNEMTAKGWISKNRIRLFKQTANSQKAIGDQARHGKDTCVPPPKPIKLSEARRLVDDLLKKWLSWKMA